MTKLAITALAVLLLVANAYAHRTTITTVEIDEESTRQSSKGKCRQQIEEADLSYCERFITDQSQRQRGIAMVNEKEGRQEAQRLQKCCTQMHKLDDKCQCEALKQIVDEGQQEEEMQGQEEQQMQQRAQTVVTYCRLPQRCQWQSALF